MSIERWELSPLISKYLSGSDITMGCGPTKDLKTNLTTDEPSQIVGSTMLQADKIIVLGDSVFLPTKTPEGESAILEVSISDKKINMYRGYRNKLVRNGIA